MCVNNQDLLRNESVKLVKMKDPLGECYTSRSETVGSHNAGIPIGQAHISFHHLQNLVFR